MATFTQVTQLSTDVDGLHVPGLCFGDPRVMVLSATLVGFAGLSTGFSNRQLVGKVASLLDRPYTSRQATYDLRRLRRKGLITRIPGTFHYQFTPVGRTVAVLFTTAYGRVLAPGLSVCDAKLPADVTSRNPSGRPGHTYLDRELDTFIDSQQLAAP